MIGHVVAAAAAAAARRPGGPAARRPGGCVAQATQIDRTGLRSHAVANLVGWDRTINAFSKEGRGGVWKPKWVCVLTLLAVALVLDGGWPVSGGGNECGKEMGEERKVTKGWCYHLPATVKLRHAVP